MIVCDKYWIDLLLIWRLRVVLILDAELERAAYKMMFESKCLNDNYDDD